MGRSVNVQAFAIIGILVASLVAAAAIGAWEDSAAHGESFSKPSNFVQSGGTVADAPGADADAVLAVQPASGPGRHASASRY